MEVGEGRVEVEWLRTESLALQVGLKATRALPCVLDGTAPTFEPHAFLLPNFVAQQPWAEATVPTQLYLNQSVDTYKEACRKGFAEHQFDAATSGLTIGNEIMQNIIKARIADTQPGQKTTVNNEDLFTMVSVLAKTNV